MNEDFLHKKLEERKRQNAYRQLRLPEGRADFCSNDYLGIVKNKLIDTGIPQKDLEPTERNHRETTVHPAPVLHHGSTGSRLLSGNYPLIEETEQFIAGFHDAPAGLIFNSGYDANAGLLSCVPQRGDTILYDQLMHASARDGIRLSFAQSFSFVHNSLDDLANKLKTAAGNIFVVTESVFSMDGDMAPLPAMAALCHQFNAHLIVDEAHATGVLGGKGEGLVQHFGLQRDCFARIHTFGKAVGCHGAIVLGSETLRDYLINFSRPLIYTTALPEISIMAIRRAYEIFPHLLKEREWLYDLIDLFEAETKTLKPGMTVLSSSSPIQAVLIPGNEEVKVLSRRLGEAGLDIRPILYPSVPKGSERLRIVLHSFNDHAELRRLMECLTNW